MRERRFTTFLSEFIREFFPIWYDQRICPKSCRRLIVHRVKNGLYVIGPILGIQPLDEPPGKGICDRKPLVRLERSQPRDLSTPIGHQPERLFRIRLARTKLLD